MRMRQSASVYKKADLIRRSVYVPCWGRDGVTTPRRRALMNPGLCPTNHQARGERLVESEPEAIDLDKQAPRSPHADTTMVEIS